MRLEKYERYQQSVSDGTVVCCKLVQQAVARQFLDIERSKGNDFPYFFDEESAERALTFIEMLRCTSGEWKGKRLVLSDFQAWRIAVVFGWLRKKDGVRRFRRAYVEVARKNGKTEEAAAIMCYGLVADGEGGAQVFSAATTRQQAKIVFNAAKMMLRELSKESAYMKKRLQVLTHRVVDTILDGYMEALSSDAWTLDGLSPHCTVVDEYHAHPTNEVLKVIETGQGARAQPMTYIITTAGYNLESPCYLLRKVAVNILAGIQEDETFFVVIYSLDEGDDWNDRAVWVKANPGVGVTPKWEALDSEYTKAKNEGQVAARDFKTKNLNLWVRSVTGWIPDEIWMAQPYAGELQTLRGQKCYGGIDLASTNDFTSLSLFFPGYGEYPHRMLWWFWLPEDRFEARTRDLPSLRDWAADGYIEVTPGNVMDYDYVQRRVMQIVEEFDVVCVGVDPHNATQLVLNLQDKGVPVQFFAQNILQMSAPTKEMQRLLGQRMLDHGRNPVVRWMMGNVVIHTDANENIKIHKGKAKDKVDGVVAAVIAVGEWMTQPVPQKSYLETEDLAIF